MLKFVCRSYCCSVASQYPIPLPASSDARVVGSSFQHAGEVCIVTHPTDREIGHVGEVQRVMVTTIAHRLQQKQNVLI